MSGISSATSSTLLASNRPAGLSTLAKTNLTLAALFWIWISSELWYEWSLSEQYGYGLFVPFLTAYLIWLRAEDRPTPRPWNHDGAVLAFLIAAALAQYPIAVIFVANADWRMLAWGEALLALAASALLLAQWGGRPWVKHFLPAFALFLFAVPWPTYLQFHTVDELMTFLATVVTEVLNLLGYDAIREGHVIRLPGSLVEVAEACSGVRSIQSTIMASWLVGEWWRFRPWGRAGLLVWACFIAITFNLLRTLALSWIDAASGPPAMEHWHDTAGYLVFGLSMATVLAGAWLARPRQKIASPNNAAAATIVSPKWISQGRTLTIIVLLVGAWPASVLWYALRAPDVTGKSQWKLNLAAVPEAKLDAPNPELKQSLYYSDGVQASWKDGAGQEWSLFNFQWAQPRAAQLGGMHSPESCLPAVGWYMAQQGENLDWQRGGLELIFNTYEFVHDTTHLYVFYCQWDPAGYHFYEKIGRFRTDRLLDAWLADRKIGKQLLEIAVGHANSLTAATESVRQFLNRAIVEIPPDSTK